MSRDEVIEHLGTIAKSGTKQFFEALTGDESKDSQLNRPIWRRFLFLFYCG